ncbi:MAG: VanZ family protein [Planctomycetota bacterium]|nr:VanZ family protein [Planctomycetota bacterium]
MTATGRWRPLPLLLAVGWGVVIWVLSTSVGHGERPPSFVSQVLWNGGHALLFGVLALLSLCGVPSGRPAFVAACLCILYGAVSEWHQTDIPGRVGSVTDWLTDTAGVVFGGSVLRWVRTGLTTWRSVLATALVCVAAAILASLA